MDQQEGREAGLAARGSGSAVLTVPANTAPRLSGLEFDPLPPLQLPLTLAARAVRPLTRVLAWWWGLMRRYLGGSR